MINLKNEKILLILRELFYVIFFSVFVFSVLELAHPKIVLAYININYLLIFWLIVGILVLVLSKESN